LLLDPSAKKRPTLSRALKILCVHEPPAPYFSHLWASFERNTYTTMLYTTLLYCYKQTMYNVSEGAFFSLIFSPGQWKVL